MCVCVCIKRKTYTYTHIYQMDQQAMQWRGPGAGQPGRQPHPGRPQLQERPRSGWRRWGWQHCRRGWHCRGRWAPGAAGLLVAARVSQWLTK